MDISLIHAGLAGGAALAALPVILHLFMKQTPKRVVFPALQLIRERQKRSKKKLRVKNWLLLIARAALVMLMALALARPRLYSQTSLGDQEVPTAVGLVFDTSLSMGYEERDKSRLAEAKERANEILRKMPDTSEVFVIDASEPGSQPFSPAAARERIKGLELRGTTRPLNVAVGQAYAAVAESDRPRHEVYVLTDLARSAWDIDHPVEGLAPADDGKGGAKAAKTKKKSTAPDIATYVLKLSPKEFRDVIVAEAAPSSSVISQGDPIEIRAKIRSIGPATKRTVEFVLDGKPRLRQPVSLPANGEVEVKYVHPKLESDVPLHQGKVSLSSGVDALKFDDVRYFTFKVRPSPQVLVVSDFAIDSEFINLALDPVVRPEGLPRTCRVTAMRTDKFAGLDADDLKDYACIFINNVAKLGVTSWGRLSQYVHEGGGGLVIGLGDRSQPEDYNATTASQLIPAAIKKAESPKGGLNFGKVTDLTHPLFKRYTREIDAQLALVPVYHYWSIAPPQGSRTLLTYSNGAPALVERTFRTAKTGRVLLWTTPLARRPLMKDPAAWNEFPLAELSYGFWVLMNQTVPYLAGSADEALNYESGQDAVLAIDPTRPFKNYTVQSADGKTTQRLSPPANSDSLVIVSPTIGQWEVTGSNPEGESRKLGFSVNPDPRETQFTPLQTQDLDKLFGKDKYKLADDAGSLSQVVAIGRIGREIFPLLMALILILVTLENLLANRFYRESTPSTSPGTKPAVGAA